MRIHRMPLSPKPPTARLAPESMSPTASAALSTTLSMRSPYLPTLARPGGFAGAARLPGVPHAASGPIVLVGFMGAGKSTVGRLLAERLGVPFADSDDVITERTGRTPREIF